MARGARFKSWLYPNGKPGRVAQVLNRGWATVHALGLRPNHLVTLDVVGRKSGQVVSLPLVMAVVDGERYLVSMLGEDVGWVKNQRAAAGRAVLRHGATEPVSLKEVPVEARPRIIQAYLKVAPGARPHVPVDKNAPLEAFGKIASEIPVFLVQPQITEKENVDD